MDPNVIFNEFLSLCEGNDIGSHLASNSALDWFGKTVNSFQIGSFYKYHFQYKHKMKNIHFCGSIETRLSHFRTIVNPMENCTMKPVNSNVREDNSSVEYESTSSVNSFDDIPEEKEKNPNFNIDCNNIDINKQNYSINENNNNKMNIEVLQNKGSNDNNSQINCVHNFSNLMYLEATGTLYSEDSKYQSIDGDNYHSDESPLRTSKINNKIRLKLSFRINKTDNFIQFALIIYEDLKPNLLVKRNLLLEFENIKTNPNLEKNKNSDGSNKGAIRKSLINNLRY